MCQRDAPSVSEMAPSGGSSTCFRGAGGEGGGGSNGGRGGEGVDGGPSGDAAWRAVQSSAGSAQDNTNNARLEDRLHSSTHGNCVVVTGVFLLFLADDTSKLPGPNVVVMTTAGGVWLIMSETGAACGS